MPPNKHNKTTPKRLEAIDRARRALELRKAGLGYERIARELGYADHSGAYRAIQAALKRTWKEPADELKRLEEERLDMALLAIAAEVKKGHLGAIDRWIKVAERRAKLLGLDAPTKVQQDLRHDFGLDWGDDGDSDDPDASAPSGPEGGSTLTGEV